MVQGVVVGCGGGGGGGDGGDINGCSEFAAASEQQLQNSKSTRSDDNGSASEYNISEAANKRLKQAPLGSNEKAQLAQTLLSLGPLGLKLGKTPSFLDLPEMAVSSRNKAKRAAAEINHNSVQAMTEKEKLKASNFCASLLKIGSWQRTSQHEGDLVAKCYYAKRKLVWEILDGGLKSKIELQWSDILAMRAVIEENQPGILEIELSQPPSFHRESNPQPRKHTMWNVASDFTNGEALTHRRHYLQFPPGALDKHYEKLIQCESRFLELSQRPFPSRRSPYFHSDFHSGVSNFSFNFDRHGQEIPSNLQFPYSSCIPTHLDPTQQIQNYGQTIPSLRVHDSTSPISVMDLSSPLDEVISNQGVENPSIPVWDQGITRAMTSFAEFLGRNQISELVSVAAEDQVNPFISCQNFNQGAGRRSLESQMLSNSENQLLMSDSQVQCTNKQVIPQVNSLFGFPKEVSSADTTRTKHYGHEMMVTNGNLVSIATADGLQPLPVSWAMPLQSVSWAMPSQPVNGVVLPQVPTKYSEQLAENNSMPSSLPPNLTMADYGTLNNLFNRWT